MQGSHIAAEDDNTIPAVLKEQRAKANGLTSWKDAGGHTLKEIESSEITEE